VRKRKLKRLGEVCGKEESSELGEDDANLEREREQSEESGEKDVEDGSSMLMAGTIE